MQTATRSNSGSVASYLKAGLIAGIAAAIIANIYYFVYGQATDNSFSELNLGSITAASIVPGLIAGVILYALQRFTSRATPLFVIGGTIFALLSIVPNIVAPPHQNFFWASSPLHIIVAAVILALLPRMARPVDA